MHTLIWAERKISQIAFQVLLKNKNLKSVRKQKKIRAKSVKIWLYINGCGSRPEKIAVATKQSAGLFLPNSLLSNCPNVAEFGASASSQIPYRSK